MGYFSFFSMLYKFSLSICTTIWNYFITITIPWNNFKLATPSVKTAKKPVRTPRSTTFLHGNVFIFKYVIFRHTTKGFVNLPYFISPCTEEKSSMKEKHGRSLGHSTSRSLSSIQVAEGYLTDWSQWRSSN